MCWPWGEDWGEDLDLRSPKWGYSCCRLGYREAGGVSFLIASIATLPTPPHTPHRCLVPFPPPGV